MIACPNCGEPTSVAETRSIDHYVRRRRHCPSIACNTRVTTAEIVIATDGVRSKALGEIVIVPKRDMQAMIEFMAEALATRMGRKAVVELVDRVLQGQPDTTTTGETGHGNGQSRSVDDTPAAE